MDCWNLNICATCLSSDRRLIPLHKIKNVLKKINFTELQFSNTASICWECKSNILKFYRFKIKALQAQTALSKNLKLNKMKSLSSLVIKMIREMVNIYHNCYNSDPLINCDNQPKLENNIIKTEIDDSLNNHDELNSTEINEKVTDSRENISHIYVETISSKKKIINDDSLIEKFTEIIALDDNLKHDNCNVPDMNKKVEALSDQIDNIIKEKVSSKNKTTNLKEPKFDGELEGRFMKIVFSDEEILQHREDKRNHYNFKKVPFKCDSCVLGFTKKEKFNKHMEKKHDESIGPHKCDICEVRFATESAVAGHRWRHYCCYRCRLCKYDTTELWSALNHCKIKHKRDHLDSIHCAQCETVARTAQELEEHIQLEHRLQCNECGVRFKGKHTLRNHMARIHATKRGYICDICAKTFLTKSRLESHMTHHNTSLAKSLSYCQQCNVQYKNIHVYRNHLKNSANHSERAFSCPECNKKFASKVYWSKHYNFFHLHKSQYNCEICNKLFISAWRLRSHRQAQHGLARARTHACDICPNTFFSKSTLRNHRLTHSAQRGYMCEACGATFRQRAALYTHARLLHARNSRATLAQLATDR